MNPRDCCEMKGRAGDDRRPASRWRRGRSIAEWIVPTAMLALLPKCPACVVAYVAFATGIGISFPVAAQLRGMLIVLCVGSLVFLMARWLWSLGARVISQEP